MGHSQDQKIKTHQRIVRAAAKRFRENGLAGVAIADLMEEVGLTVGGFYKHFDSRDDLVLEAFRAETGYATPKVDVRDPMKAHRDLLAVYTDKDMHDVTAYLVTLK